MHLTEEQTRKQLINRQLQQAGWRRDDLTQVRHEVPADDAVREPAEAYGSPGTRGTIDEYLYEETVALWNASAGPRVPAPSRAPVSVAAAPGV